MVFVILFVHDYKISRIDTLNSIEAWVHWISGLKLILPDSLYSHWPADFFLSKSRLHAIMFSFFVSLESISVSCTLVTMNLIIIIFDVCFW